MEKDNDVTHTHLLSYNTIHGTIQQPYPAISVYHTIEFGTFPNTDTVRQLKIPYQADEKEPSAILLNIFSELLKIEGVEEVLKKYGVSWSNL